MSAKMSLEAWLHEAYAMPRPDCPPREQLHRLALRDLDPDQRTLLREHLNRCPACAAEHDAAVLFESTSAEDINASDVAKIVARLEQESPVRVATGRRHTRVRDQGRDRLRTWFAWPRAVSGWQLAAAAAFVVIVIVSTWQHPPSLPFAHETVLRGSVVHTISPQGNVRVSPAQLAWQLYPEATTYRVQLLRVDDTVLWGGTVADSTIHLPAAVREQLLPLVRYVWTVEALNEAGNLVAASELQSFVIRPVKSPAPQGR